MFKIISKKDYEGLLEEVTSLRRELAKEKKSYEDNKQTLDDALRTIEKLKKQAKDCGGVKNALSDILAKNAELEEKNKVLRASAESYKSCYEESQKKLNTVEKKYNNLLKELEKNITGSTVENSEPTPKKKTTRAKKGTKDGK